MSDADVAPSPRPLAKLYAEPTQARAAIEALEAAGVGADAISILSRSTTEADELERATGASDDLEDTTTRPHHVADFFGWLGRVGGAVVPGFGSVMGSGNLWQDVARGSDQRGAITGALVGQGVQVDDAARFEDAVLEGQILVVVHGEEVDLTEDEVRAILDR
jgi:hypothetical protein